MVTEEKKPPNPFDSEAARENSCYSRVEGEDLVNVESGKAPPPLVQRVHSALRALILDPEYPCVGSRSALNQGSYRFALYTEMNTAETTAALARDLYSFVQEQESIEGEFTTFIAVFDSPKSLTPEEYEEQLWKQLQALHELDKEHHEWASDVSKDPEADNFAFSFAERSFFIAGLSPQAERWARRFPWPMMAFNAHFQFVKLRENGKFEMIRDTIRQREANIEGEANENVEDFGEHTEARQYAGRTVPDDWKCPAHFG